MKSFITYLILFISTILLNGCKKYPEDGKRSWHKPEKRIVGAWYLKEYYVNGEDSTYKWYDKKTNDVTDTIQWQLANTRFSFVDGKDKKSLEGQTVDITTEQIKFYNSYYGKQRVLHLVTKWDLISKKTQVQFDLTYSFLKAGSVFTTFSILGNGTNQWNIQKLTDKEMILESFSNKHLRIKFQKRF